MGYSNDHHGLKGQKRIFKDPQLWDKVRKVWDLALTGNYSILQIIDIANNELGLRTRRGRKLASSTLHSVLRNPFYAGLMEIKGEIKQGLHDSMVSLQEFEKVQIILGTNGKKRLRTFQHTYTGIIRCAECGGMITAEPPKIKKHKNGNVHIYQYMRCTKRKSGVQCFQKCIRMDRLEEQITNLLSKIEIPAPIQEWVFEQIRKENEKEKQSLAHKRGYLQSQYNENEALIEILTTKLLKGIIDDDTYKKSKTEFEMKRARLKEEMERYDKNKDDWLEKQIADFKFACESYKAFNKGGPEIRRQIFMDLGSNFLLKDRELRLDLRFPFELIEKGVKETKLLLTRFEPTEKVLSQPKKSLSEELFSIWSHRRELNP